MMMMKRGEEGEWEGDEDEGDKREQDEENGKKGTS